MNELNTFEVETVSGGFLCLLTGAAILGGLGLAAGVGTAAAVTGAAVVGTGAAVAGAAGAAGVGYFLYRYGTAEVNIYNFHYTYRYPG